MSTYLFVTDPEKHDVVSVETAKGYWWSCSKTALPGDAALVYLTGGIGIEYEWQIASQAEANAEWGFVCDVKHVRKFKPPISLKEICSAIPRTEWKPPHQNFRGFRSIRVPDSVAERLRQLRPHYVPPDSAGGRGVIAQHQKKRRRGR
jgi:hypothetical protein